MKLGHGVGAEPSPDAATYTYAGMGYANPDAVTQIANGLSTTTFQFDNNGNVIQKTTDGTTTTYIYDYANRLTALGVAGATTTYAYDAFGARVIQTGTTTTTLYPFKWHSVASSTGTGAKYSTTTSYMFNGDTLLATVDQQLASGVATGTAKTRYVHPDHLGSTNVVTDENDNLVQTLDYYPYGATRISVATSTNEKRKYIDQFSDDSGLSYLNARYYSPTQGQFLSQDPVFWSKQNLSNPQSFNTYSYAGDNPIVKKDPSGMIAGWDDMIGSGAGALVSFDAYTVRTAITGQPETWAGAGNAIVTGAIMGEGIVNAPETGGTSVEAALATIRAAATVGARAGFYGNATEQTINVAQGNQPGVDWNALALSTAKGALTNVLLRSVPDACLPGLSCGGANWNSLAKAMGTKSSNGTIGSVSIQTSLKSAAGTQAAGLYRTSTGAILDSSSNSSKSAPASQPGGGTSVSTWMGAFNPFLPHH